MLKIKIPKFVFAECLVDSSVVIGSVSAVNHCVAHAERFHEISKFLVTHCFKVNLIFFSIILDFHLEVFCLKIYAKDFFLENV